MSGAAPRLVLDNTYGALLIGTIIAMSLWGAATVQFYYYFNQYPKDDWRLKCLVIVVWALDTLHQGLIVHSCYAYLVTNYANMLFLLTITPSLSLMVLISALVCVLAQFFLIYRVWMISEKNLILVAVLLAMVITQFVCTVFYYAKGRGLTVLEIPTIGWLSKLINGLAAGTDLAIAFVLIYLLHRSRTGFRSSKTMINKLIILTINTGLLTSIFALFSVIFVCLYPDTLIYVGVYVNVSRMYTNTLLATLNARNSVRSTAEASSMSLSRETPSAPSKPVNRARNSRLAIRVETETTHDPDNIFLGDLERGSSKPRPNDWSQSTLSCEYKSQG